MTWHKNISIRTSFVLYMLFFIMLATVLSGLFLKAIGAMEQQIQNAYFDEGREQFYLTTEDGRRLGDGLGIIAGQEEQKYSKEDKQKLFVLEFLSMIASPVAFLLCTGIAASLFYRIKLRNPIAILNTASGKIASDDLDFTVEYSSQDELGKLCVSFEKMRRTLEKNNSKMWRSIEERKRLNAAFSHDLRTPLTVLRGYTEFLSTYLTDESLSKEKVVSAVYTMRGQVQRLEAYVESVNEIQRLEEIEPKVRKVFLNELLQAFYETTEIVKGNKVVEFSSAILDGELVFIDLDLVFRVFENLISNAIRYAKSQIKVSVSVEDSFLKVMVSDDGEGFDTEASRRAAEPFYRGDHKHDKLHFGLGLYICRIICEKHGGELRFSNSGNGAVLLAKFHSVINL